MYMYCAELFCDECGLQLIQDLEESFTLNNGDSDTFPQPATDNQEADYPLHCASFENCKDPIDLTQYGLHPIARLHGSEVRLIGCILSDQLTDEGVRFLKEILSTPESTKTPYQKALHACWTETYGSYL